jgi:hypothetical protein
MLKYFCFLFVAPLVLFQAEAQQKGRANDIFAASNLLFFTIETNFDSLILDMHGEKVTRHARISYLDNYNSRITSEVEIATRGRFRRRPENCDFPPLLLDFKNFPDTALFKGQSSIQMVTHCKTATPQFIQYIWGEYLIYEMYTRITPYAYKVRPVLYTYINTGSSFSSMNKYGFFLENTKHLEKRLKVKATKDKEANPLQLDQEAYKRLCFFEYMISNNDWAVSILHNIKLIKTDKYSAPIPVPFDFDWAGMLNIPYKIPGVERNSTLKPDRTFHGEFNSRKELKETIRFYNSKKKELLYLVQALPYLEDSVKTRFISQIEEFYQIINSPLAVRKLILHKPLLQFTRPKETSTEK